MSLASGGKFLTLFSVKFINLDLVLSRALQLARMWGRSSEIYKFEQVDRRQTPCLLRDQCLHSLTVLYRPGNGFAKNCYKEQLNL